MIIKSVIQIKLKKLKNKKCNTNKAKKPKNKCNIDKTEKSRKIKTVI